MSFARDTPLDPNCSDICHFVAASTKGPPSDRARSLSIKPRPSAPQTRWNEATWKRHMK